MTGEPAHQQVPGAALLKLGPGRHQPVGASPAAREKGLHVRIGIEPSDAVVGIEGDPIQLRSAQRGARHALGCGDAGMNTAQQVRATALTVDTRAYGTIRLSVMRNRHGNQEFLASNLLPAAATLLLQPLAD